MEPSSCDRIYSHKILNCNCYGSILQNIVYILYNTHAMKWWPRGPKHVRLKKIYIYVTKISHLKVINKLEYNIVWWTKMQIIKISKFLCYKMGWALSMPSQSLLSHSQNPSIPHLMVPFTEPWSVISSTLKMSVDGLCKTH
jgi:hypothetical protein